MTKPAACALTLTLALALPMAARAELQDEVQVYDDAINERGERGLEVHINTTPSGRRTPDYPGEVPPWHAWRVTPEFSYGLTQSVELGLYVPMLREANGHFDIAGLKLRLKWLPLAPEGGQGAFAGVNFELSRLGQRYSESRTSMESRFILGYRTGDWLLAINPILGFSLSDGMASDRPTLDVGTKVTRNVASGLAAGVEYHATPGALGRTQGWQQQDQRVFLTLDVDRKPFVFNVGVGRGLTDASDRWTVKAILEFAI